MIRYTVLLLLISMTTKAQVTLEHDYKAPLYPMYLIVQDVENDGKKYVLYDTVTKHVQLYNTDHTLWKSMKVALPASSTLIFVYPGYISRTLFDSDNDIEFLISFSYTQGNTTLYLTQICNEDGTVNKFFSNVSSAQVVNIDGKFKLIANSNDIPHHIEVYSLPGTYAGLAKPGRPETETELYPNPMDEAATLSYSLPTGVQSGNIQVYNSMGVLVRNYQVTSQFSYITIQRNELPAGAYIYKLLAPGAEPASSSFIIR